jgi:hypothetical protein
MCWAAGIIELIYSVVASQKIKLINNPLIMAINSIQEVVQNTQLT